MKNIFRWQVFSHTYNQFLLYVKKLKNSLNDHIDSIIKKIKEIAKFLRSIWTGIKNTIVWLPVIWRDQQWDHFYLYKVMQKKLILMEKFWASGETTTANPERTEKQIRVVRILCDRLIAHDYLSNAMLFNKDIRPEHFKFYFEECPDRPGFHQLIDRRSEKEKKAFRQAGKLAETVEKQDKEYMFDLLKKNIDNWWD